MSGHDRGRKRLQRGFFIGLASAAAALLLWQTGLFKTWEAKTWDWRVRIMAHPGRYTDRIKLILLDQNSLDWAEQENGLSWPWPREIYTPIIDFCRRSGAKSLAFDVLFTESSQYGMEDDNTLGRAIHAFGDWVGALFLGRSTGSDKKWPAGLTPPSLKLTGIDSLPERTRAKITFPRATFPIPQVAANAKILANVHLDPDPDGIYRRVNLFALFDGHAVPSLSLGAYLAAAPDAGGSAGPGKLSIGGRLIPLGVNNEAILNFRGPSSSYQAYSAAAVIQSELRLQAGGEPAIKEPAPFKDCYVLVGFTAPGLFDLRPAPVSGIYPGVAIHATALDNLLAGDFHRMASPLLVAVLAAVLALLAAVTVSWYTRGAAVFVSFPLFLALPFPLAFFAYSRQVWLPLIVLEAGIIFSLVNGLFLNFIIEGRQKRFIKQAFKQYLSPKVIDQLMKDPDRLQLGGERRVLSIFFSDLQGFTTISESLSPEKLTTFLNEYLTAMTGIIHEEGGTIDKFEGDAIIAFWNAPVEQADHAERAVRAALRCQELLAEMRPGFRRRIGSDLLMRVGINTGEAVVGNMGSDSRFDYTMLGDAVNLAARLEGANKYFGTYTMISESTCNRLEGQYACRELAKLKVVGRKEPVRVYEPLISSADSSAEDRRIFNNGLQFFYDGKIDQALEEFMKTADRDSAAEQYVVKCRELLNNIPEEWDGVWELGTK